MAINKRKNKKKKSYVLEWIILITIVIIILIIDLFFLLNYFNIQSEKEISKPKENLPEIIKNITLDKNVIENEIFKLINNEREKQRKRTLLENEQLQKQAKEYSFKMLQENFFSHSKFPKGQNIGQIKINTNTEECGTVFTNEEIANCIIKSWKEHLGYYPNMISSEYVRVGVGVSCDQSLCKVTTYFN